MVLPSHIPPLAWGRACALGRGGGGGRWPGGGAAEANRRFACPPVRRAACGPYASPLQGAAGIDFWRRKACALLDFLGCRDTFFRKNSDFLLHFRRDLRYIG